MQFTGAVPFPRQYAPGGQIMGAISLDGQYDLGGHHVHDDEFAAEYVPGSHL